MLSQAFDVTSADLTAGGLTLVYAATPTGATSGSDLYVSYRADPGSEFQAGTRISLPGVDAEEVELYFRRDSQILVAR